MESSCFPSGPAAQAGRSRAGGRVGAGTHEATVDDTLCCFRDAIDQAVSNRLNREQSIERLTNMRQHRALTPVFDPPWRTVRVAGRRVVAPQIEVNTISVRHQAKSKTHIGVRQAVYDVAKLLCFKTSMAGRESRYGLYP